MVSLLAFSLNLLVRKTNGLRIELSIYFQQKCCENSSKLSHVLGDVQGVTSLAAERFCRLYKLICYSLMAAFLPRKIGVLPEAIHINLQSFKTTQEYMSEECPIFSKLFHLFKEGSSSRKAGQTKSTTLNMPIRDPQENGGKAKSH